MLCPLLPDTNLLLFPFTLPSPTAVIQPSCSSSMFLPPGLCTFHFLTLSFQLSIRLTAHIIEVPSQILPLLRRLLYSLHLTLYPIIHKPHVLLCFLEGLLLLWYDSISLLSPILKNFLRAWLLAFVHCSILSAVLDPEGNRCIESDFSQKQHV